MGLNPRKTILEKPLRTKVSAKADPGMKRMTKQQSSRSSSCPKE
jgi:hypothetical protein